MIWFSYTDKLYIKMFGINCFFTTKISSPPGISIQIWRKQWKWHDILLFQLFGLVLFLAHVYGSFAGPSSCWRSPCWHLIMSNQLDKFGTPYCWSPIAFHIPQNNLRYIMEHSQFRLNHGWDNVLLLCLACIKLQGRHSQLLVGKVATFAYKGSYKLL